MQKEQNKVGTIFELGQNNRTKIVCVLSVAMKDEGNFAFTVFGLTMHGEFNATRTWKKQKDEEIAERIQPDTIPFKVNGARFLNRQDPAQPTLNSSLRKTEAPRLFIPSENKNNLALTQGWSSPKNRKRGGMSETPQQNLV